MNRTALKWILTSAALLAPATTYAQVACTRPGLQAAADLYAAAQTKGDTAGMPLAMSVAYIENNKIMPIAEGIIKKPMKIDHTFSLIDTATCQTFTQVIITDKAAPHVLGTRLRINHGLIAEIETVWTTTGYWLFNADAYLKYATTENWGPIAEAKRDSRSALESAANSYLDAFLEGKMDLVPWGFPCNRTEGGAHSGKGEATDTCQDGVPSGVNIVARHYVVDETVGAIVAFCTFGVNGSADTHMFRLENGKLRFAHTLTHLLQANFSGNAKGKGGPPPNNQKQ
ncbi:MAG: hypothetical protein WDO18_22170 [Acidobacteriota bacterium]